MAAQAALAAANQERFTEMHDLLFANYKQFSTLAATRAADLGLPAGQARSPEVQAALFTGFAEQLGLDMSRFQADLQSEATRRQIAQDTREVRSTGSTGTPASYVNGRFLSGAQPYETFKKMVDEALQESGSAVAAGTVP